MRLKTTLFFLLFLFQGCLCSSLKKNGEDCKKNEECQSNLCRHSFCTAECQTKKDACNTKGGGKCVSIGGSSYLCLLPCQHNGVCPSATTCRHWKATSSGLEEEENCNPNKHGESCWCWVTET